MNSAARGKLEKLLAHSDGIHFSEHLDGDGAIVFEQARHADKLIKDMLQRGELIKVNLKRDVYEIAGSLAHAYNAECAPRRDLY